MKKLLPALCLLLALAACGGEKTPAATAPSSSAAAETAETADTTLLVILDCSAALDKVGPENFTEMPIFSLDAEGNQLLQIVQASYGGSRVTYKVTAPEETTDLYVQPVNLLVLEEVGDQWVAPRGDMPLEDFRIEKVTIDDSDGMQVVVKIDPTSGAFPADLRLEMNGYTYTGGYSVRRGGEDGNTLEEWNVRFEVPGTTEEVRQGLIDATLRWTTLCRYADPGVLSYACSGVTFHTRS